MTDLILGTAQFGPGYGITNESRRIDDGEVADTLRTAVAAGIRVFDTADAYGDAQERLGQLMPTGADVEYISKFSLKGLPNASSLYVHSMERLQVKTLRGLLAHNAADFLDDRFPEALAIIRSAKSDGVIGLIGASVYDQGELELAMRMIPELDVIQIPGSFVDRRLLDSHLVRDLKEKGVQVHVRSAFLQGMLLSAEEKIPARFAALRPVISQLDSTAKSMGLSRLCLLLGFLKFHDAVDAVVVGAASHRELDSIVREWGVASPLSLPHETDELLPWIIDPRQW